MQLVVLPLCKLCGVSVEARDRVAGTILSFFVRPGGWVGGVCIAVILCVLIGALILLTFFVPKMAEGAVAPAEEGPLASRPGGAAATARSTSRAPATARAPLPPQTAVRGPGEAVRAGEPAAGGTFKVYVTAPAPDIGRGRFRCMILATGLRLTHRKKAPVEIPVGTPVEYVDGARFTAALPGGKVILKLRLVTKCRERLTRALVKFLRGQGAPPTLGDYALPWYFYMTTFLPLAIPLVTWTIGGIPLVIAGAAMGVCGFLAQRERWPAWLRLGLSVGTFFAGIIAIIVLNVAILLHSGKALPWPWVYFGNAEQQKLHAVTTAWQPSAGTPVNLLGALQGTPKRGEDGSIILDRGVRIETKQRFRVPATFRIVVQTDGADVRLHYAADQLIFNWENNKNELRVVGGPANGRHQPGAGRLPDNVWVGIEWVVRPDEMIVYVDGTERYRTRANFSRVDQPLAIECHGGGTEVKVKSLEVLQP